MRLSGWQVSTRFFAALAALLAAFVAVGLLGYFGMRSVERANDQVFNDNFRTAETNAKLTNDLRGAQGTVVEALAATRLAETERLRTRLHEIAVPAVERDIAQLVDLHAGDPPAEAAEIAQIPRAWSSVATLLGGRALATDSHGPSAAERAAALARVKVTLDPLIAHIAARQAIEIKHAGAAHARAQRIFRRGRDWLILAGLIALLAAAVLLRVGGALRQLLADQARERRHGERAGEYIDVLQGTESEDEAQELLRRQIERTNADARSIVLVRNNSDDRLEPRTSLAAFAELREPLLDAAPRSCMAVRFAREHHQGSGRPPLAGCELCGRLAGSSLCEPLLVGGEVIGSVLVNRPSEPDEEDRRRTRETVAQAAPVLGNLRNLALARLRAATDQLTGLPNQRGVQDTLKRMVAQASRTISPLAAILLDLDHFKRINDVYGHDRGDEVLAAVGVALRNTVRESDFVGRYGGEEFLVLLPSSDREGAIHVAESVRSAIAAIEVPGVEQRFTASAGVAVLPDDGGEAVTLFRAADRALYAAKHAGRNRVRAAHDGPISDVEPAGDADVPSVTPAPPAGR